MSINTLLSPFKNQGYQKHDGDFKEERKTNIEIIRILAMSMIVIWHFMIHGGLLEHVYLSRFFIPFVIGGVDLFILISGYFLIKLNWRSVIRLIVTIWFFQIFTFVAYNLFAIGNISLIDLKYRFIAPLSRTYWFISNYTALMVLSPLINYSMQGLGLHNLRKVVVIVSFINFYSCWICYANISYFGYDLFNFIHLYILGYYLKAEKFCATVKRNKIVSFSICALILNLVFNSYYVFTQFGPSIEEGISRIAYSRPTSYNSAFLIIFCASLFLLFTRLHIQSKSINSLAKASLGVYLLQEGIGSELYYGILEQTLQSDGIVSYVMVCLLFFIGYWTLSWIITQFVHRIHRVLCEWIAKHVPQKYLFNFR